MAETHRWTFKKTGLVLQVRTQLHPDRLYPPEYTEWEDVADVNGDVPRIETAAATNANHDGGP
jgi:hypothetical protein